MAMLWMLLSCVLLGHVLGDSSNQVLEKSLGSTNTQAESSATVVEKSLGPRKPQAMAVVSPATGCDKITLYGTSSHTSIEGEYQYIENGCGLNRNVYYNSHAGYYLFYESSSPAGWLFSDTKCSTTGAVKADSTASIPESVTVDWDETILNTWGANTQISTNCYEAGCDTITLSGTSSHATTEGEYKYIENGCGLDRSVYYNSEADHYLFYQTSSPRGWLFSDTKCSTVGTVKADTTVSIPESVLSWDEASSSNSWVNNAFLTTDCNGAGMVQSSIVLMLVAMVITRD